MTGISIIVCGGRNYFDLVRVNKELDRLHAETPIKRLWHGDAQGADRCAGVWGALHRVPVTPVPVDWKTHGRPAGCIRNQKMLDMATLHKDGLDLVVCFPGGKGTAHMRYIAEKAGVKTRVIP